MILNSHKLNELLNAETPIVSNFEPNSLIETGIKIHLDAALKELISDVDTHVLEDAKYREFRMNADGYVLKPNEFLVGLTKETINMPKGYWGFIDTRGALTKLGLSLVLDYHIDPEFSGQLSLQLINHSKHCIKIYPDLYVLRMTVFEVQP